MTSRSILMLFTRRLGISDNRFAPTFEPAENPQFAQDIRTNSTPSATLPSTKSHRNAVHSNDKGKYKVNALRWRLYFTHFHYSLAVLHSRPERAAQFCDQTSASRQHETLLHHDSPQHQRVSLEPI